MTETSQSPKLKLEIEASASAATEGDFSENVLVLQTTLLQKSQPS